MSLQQWTPSCQGNIHFIVFHANKKHSSGSRGLEHVGRPWPYNFRLDKSIKLGGREGSTQRKMGNRIKQNMDFAKLDQPEELSGNQLPRKRKFTFFFFLIYLLGPQFPCQWAVTSWVPIPLCLLVLQQLPRVNAPDKNSAAEGVQLAQSPQDRNWRGRLFSFRRKTLKLCSALFWLLTLSSHSLILSALLFPSWCPADSRNPIFTH